MFIGGYRDFLAPPVRMQQSSLANFKFALKKCISSKLPDNLFQEGTNVLYKYGLGWIILNVIF